MARTNHTQRLVRTEEALSVLFCLIDDAYALLNPNGRRYGSLKRLSDSEILTLALVQQLRGVESERSFLRDAQRFFSHLFPGVVGLVTLPRFTAGLQEAAVLPGAPASGDRSRPGRRSRDPVGRLHPACRAAPQAGRSVGGFPGSGMGQVGFLQRLRGEAAPYLRDQRGSHLLRADPCQRRGGTPEGGTARRGKPG